MNYEKKYKEALERAKNYYSTTDSVADTELIELIFPELKESEDERIRKEIIAFLTCYHTGQGNSVKYDDDWIAWLEKQGSESNWCHHNVDLSNCSEEYRKAYYDGWNNCNQQHSQCKSDGNDVVKCLINGMKFYYEDNEEATWGTEKFSMKVKDILSWLEKQVPINEEAEKEKNDYVSGQFLYCKGSFNEFKEGESYWIEYIGNDTYIGRSDNILNQKFHITPRQLYTWLDPRHLEKQDEQKLNANCLLSWSEIDEKMLQSLEGIVKDYWAKAEQEKNEIKIREASNVSYFLKTIQKSPLCWIKCSDGLPNRDGTYLVVTDGRHNDVYDMARYDSIEGWYKASEIIYWMPIPQLNNKSIIEQKPADNIEKPWSEDDNRHFERILKELKNQWQRPSNRPYLDEIVSDYYWLKSIKDRVQLKQEYVEQQVKYRKL